MYTPLSIEVAARQCCGGAFGLRCTAQGSVSHAFTSRCGRRGSGAVLLREDREQ